MPFEKYKYMYVDCGNLGSNDSETVLSQGPWDYEDYLQVVISVYLISG